MIIAVTTTVIIIVIIIIILKGTISYLSQKLLEGENPTVNCISKISRK